MANTFNRILSRNIGTTLTVVGSYQVPTLTTTTVIGLSVANVAATEIIADVLLNDGTNNTYLIKNGVIPAGASLVVIGGDQKVIMKPNDNIKVVSNTVSSADVIMSILETV